MAEDDNRTGKGPTRPKRQRDLLMAFRCLAHERTAIRANADKAGLAVGAFLRAAALGSPGPRAKRRPPADHQVLRQLLGHLGRIGNNINQIARRLNAGAQADIPELREALTAYLEIRNGIFSALGMEPKVVPPAVLPPDDKPPHDNKRRQPRGP